MIGTKEFSRILWPKFDTFCSDTSEQNAYATLDVTLAVDLDHIIPNQFYGYRL